MASSPMDPLNPNPISPAFLSTTIPLVEGRTIYPAIGSAFRLKPVVKPTIVSNSLSTTATDDSIVPSAKSLRHKLDVDVNDYAVRNPVIVGHRGALYLELENTREGFQKCAELGCDAVELDVFLLRCGTLVVFHGGGTDENPGDLRDYCKVEGNILDLTYEEAKKLIFNTEYGEFPCAPSIIQKGSIPTLEEVLLDAKASGLHIKIELKGPDTVERTLEVVERLDMVQQCSFSTFDLDRLAQLRRLRPERNQTGEYVYKTGALFDDIPDDFIQQAKNAGASEIHLRYDTCTPSIISQIHENGMGSMCWFRGAIGMTSDSLEKYWDVGNEDEVMYATVLRTGVQQLCLNKPDVMLRLQRHRQRLASDKLVDEAPNR